MKGIGDIKDGIKKPDFLFRLRNYFVTGLLVLTPSAVTIWILIRVFKWFDNILGRWYVRLFENIGMTTTYFPGLGAVSLAILIVLTGYFARQFVGREIIKLWEKFINYVPLINRIYLAVRQLSDSVASGGGVIFQAPVMVEYPRRGVYSVGFITRNCEGTFCKLIGGEVSSVFIPTTPNPTSGLVIFMKTEELIPLDMSIEDAMKLIISAGYVTPDIKLPETRSE